MNISTDLSRGSTALFTDLYQLTMAQAYWKEGLANQQSVFHLFFRNNPFKGGYVVTAGLEYVVNFLKDLRFSNADLHYLEGIESSDGTPMFEKSFLAYLGRQQFSCSVDAVPEGTVMFPHAPIIRVEGPVIQCQIIESPLLNMINFQSLIATKAARMVMAAAGKDIMEFGLRRAQGIDGALSASRAAYIGGCSSTSNLLAGKQFGIPVAGTHAHSWVMSFDSELESFKSYARAMPGNCIFLVDTYDTIAGVEKAIEVGRILEARNQKLLGIRIDSGDLAYFSAIARDMLDQAGFMETKIVASNDLDEHIIDSLNDQDSEIDQWGVGTKLVTAFDQPALGGVYKLGAIHKDNGWIYKLKLSEQAVKINNPGVQQVRRFFNNDGMIADMIYDIHSFEEKQFKLIDPLDHTRRKVIAKTTPYKDLLIPVFKEGRLVYSLPEIEEIRTQVRHGLSQLDKGIKRFINPHRYPVGLEQSLHQLKNQLIMDLRKNS